MKKLLLTFLVLVAYLAGCCSVPPNFTDSKEQARTHIENLQYTTAALIHKDHEAGQYEIHCSAVWISPTKLLTARHCVEPEIMGDLNLLFGVPPDLKKLIGVVVPYYGYEDKDHRFKLGEGKNPHFAIIVAYDENVDLALLESIDESNHAYAPLAVSPTWTGQDVHIVGHTLGFPWNYMTGKVSHPARNMGPAGTEWFAADVVSLHIIAPVGPGNSGGGAFDQQGQLIGIASYMATRVAAEAFFVTQDQIKEFLEKEYALP